MTLSVCLILKNYLRIPGRTKLKSAMLRASCMILLLFLLRGLKYCAFGNIAASGRYMWYLYYVPMLCIPMSMLYVSLPVYANDEATIMKRYRRVAYITLALILLVLSNDLHRKVFRFRPGLVNWDSDYSYGIGFAAVTFWEYLLYTVSVAVLILSALLRG